MFGGESMKVGIPVYSMHALRKFDSDASVERSLEFTNIAIVSHDFRRDSPALGDMKGLMRRGFNVFPVNSESAVKGFKINGVEVSESVAEIDEEVQVVVVHLGSEWVFDVIADLSHRTELWADIRTLWLEPGVEVSEDVLSDAHDFGWMVVQGRCILSEVMERNISHD